jgi:serine/threonine-protein kinase
MNDARWQRIQDLFHRAVDLPEADWRAFLQRSCGDDDALAAEVLAMLEEDARGASLLDRGVADVAQRMIGGDDPVLPAAGAFGPYRITGVLGEGGMGIVYRAERMDLGSVVAIKILRDAWLSPARRDRFGREQRMLAQLKHPSIATLHDAGALPDGTPWFVMEYVDGLPITEHCRSRNSTIADRLRLFRKVCEAVQHAHRHLVIHRDLKPSNILVTPEGDVKLLDFGISKRLDGSDRLTDQTRTGLRLMTPAYAAPEQLRGASPAVDTDVYSLGVVLYELLAGRLPFDLLKCTPSEAVGIVAEQAPDKPSAVAGRTGTTPSVATGGSRTGSRASWADLDVLILTAMHRDRARRYATVEALMRDVDHYLHRQPLDARPDTFRYRAGKFATRNRGGLAAATVALAILTGLVVFYTARVTAARNAALAEATRTRRIQQFMFSLFEGGEKEDGPSEGLLAVTLVDRGVRDAQALAAEPVVQADLYDTLGNMYETLGNFGQADTLLRLALDRRRSLFGPDHPAVAKSLVDLALLRSDEAKFEEAEATVRDGLAMAKRTLPPEHPDVAKATTVLGRVLGDRGAYAKAIPVLEEAIRLYSATGQEGIDLANAVTVLANCQLYAGHYQASRSLNQRALALDRKLHGDRHPAVSIDLFNLGAIQAELGHYPEAEAYYRQGLAITEAWYGPDHYQTAADITLLGRVLIQEDRSAEALGLLQRALVIRERVYGKVHPGVASVLGDLGKIALAQKSYDEAEADFRRMVAIYRAVHGGDHHHMVGTALANLGDVYLDRQQLTEAEQLFRQAIAIHLATLSAEHPSTAADRIRLGRSLLRQRRHAEAKTQTLAGYEILRKQVNPTVSWLQKAREDLVTESESLDQQEQAAKFRAEILSTK